MSNINYTKPNKLEDFSAWCSKKYPLWCKSNFPFIEDTFEALDTYGLICKIVQYLNETKQNLNTTEDNVQNIYNFVTNYFDNLDVQKEINNKLDSMVSSGELQNLLSEQYEQLRNEVNSQILNQNINISNINNKVNSISSGSPAGVYDTLEELIQDDPSHDKIYIVKEDGEWYYWDSYINQWNNGSVYQSTGISNNSIGIDKLFSNLKDSFYPHFYNNSYKNDIEIGKYVNNNGRIESHESTVLADIEVYENENYVFSAGYNTGIFGTVNPLYLILDENNEIIESEIINSTMNEILTRNIVIPKNGKRLLINSINWNNSSINTRFGIVILKVENYIQKNNIKYSQLDNKLKQVIIEKFDNFPIDSLEILKSPGLLGTGMEISNTQGYTIYKLNVTPGEKYIFNIYKFYNQVSIYLGSKDIIYPITSSDSIIYELHGQMKQLKGENSNSYNTIEFEIPEGCDIIYINNQDNKEFTIKKLTGYEINISSIENAEKNPLTNKIICFNGDSITQASVNSDGNSEPIPPYNNRGWVTRTKENNPNTEVYGYGVGGSTIAKREGRTDSIIERTVEILNSHSNLDYIIIEGGINDMFVNIPIGEITQGYNDEYNEFTFCGALEYLFKYITLNFKGKKCGFINIFKVPHCYTQKDYVPKIIEICKKWQIPLLNLYDESDLNYYLNEIKEEFSQITEQSPNGDGLHPNSKGYNLLQNKIESWIKTL